MNLNIDGNEQKKGRKERKKIDEKIGKIEGKISSEINEKKGDKKRGRGGSSRGRVEKYERMRSRGCLADV